MSMCDLNPKDKLHPVSPMTFELCHTIDSHYVSFRPISKLFLMLVLFSTNEDLIFYGFSTFHPHRS